jgi:hypothetical protein
MAVELASLTHEIAEFVSRNKIGEAYNHNAEFQYLLKNEEDKIIGLVAYMLQPDAAGAIYPRFIHVIFDESIRRSKKMLSFVFDTFKDIKAKGYDRIVVVCPKWRSNMITYLDKLKFKKYSEDDKLTYWVKEL